MFISRGTEGDGGLCVGELRGLGEQARGKKEHDDKRERQPAS